MGWTIASTIAQWVSDALAAARTKREQRFAHVVSNAGVIVVGLRSIDRELQRLFRPLVYFPPAMWTPQRRQEHAEAILALSHEGVVGPRIRAADAALAESQEQLSDAALRQLVGQIRIPDMSQSAPESVTSDLVNVSMFFSAIDAPITEVMPAVVDALVNLDEGSIEQVKQDAAEILGIGRYWSEPGAPDAGVPPLARLAQDREVLFGRLMGYQQREFERLPPPMWVYEA